MKVLEKVALVWGWVLLVLPLGAATPGTLTLALDGDGFTLRPAAPTAAALQSDDAGVLAWLRGTLLPRVRAEWTEQKPETLLDADGLLKALLPEVRPLPAGFQGVSVQIDSNASNDQRAVFALSFAAPNAQATLDLVIETSWLPPGEAWRTTVGELSEAVAASPADRLAVTTEDIAQARRQAAMTVYFIAVAGAESEIAAAAPPRPIPPRLAATAVAIAAEMSRRDLLAQWSASAQASPPAGALDALRAGLQRQFNTGARQAMTPDFVLKPEKFDEGRYRLKVLRFDPIARQRVRLARWAGHEGESLPEERLTQLRERGLETEGLRQHFAAIESTYSAQLDAAPENRLEPPAYLTETEAVARANFVGGMKRVRRPVPFGVDTAEEAAPNRGERTLFFDITYQPRLDEISAQVETNPEEGAVGSVAFSSRNLTAGLDDALSASFDAGLESQDAELSYTTATRTTSHQRAWQGKIAATLGRDEEQRFGRTAVQATGEKANVDLGLDYWVFETSSVATANAPGVRRWLTASPKAGWTRETLIADGALFTRDPSYRGARAGLALDFGWREDRVATFDRKLNASRRTARVTLESTHTWREGGADFTVTRFTGDTQWQFGPGGERRYYAGFALNAGTASRETPVGAQGRLGGDAWLRGLEEGEIVGRHFFAARIEGGLNPFSLFGANPAPVPKAGSAPTAEKKPPSVAEAPFLLVAAVEHGRVSGVMGLVPGATRSAATSFGLGLQFQGATGGQNPLPFELNLGYAWSPQGWRERGRVYASFQFLFPIRNSTQSP